jgi:hypothetical protein
MRRKKISVKWLCFLAKGRSILATNFLLFVLTFHVCFFLASSFTRVQYEIVLI